jgi:nucleoid-associated protein EbfC
VSMEDPAQVGNQLGGLGDLSGLLRQAQAMQEQLMAAQEAAGAAIHEGVSGGGKVSVTVTGTGEFRSVRIDPSVIDPAEADMLEDLVLAALHDASAKVAAASQAAMGDIGGSLGGLSGLLG